MPEPATLFFDQKHPEWPASECALFVDRLLHWMEEHGWPEPKANASLREKRRFLYQVYAKQYVRTVEGMDANVERLLDYLTENGLKRNTIVVYTSDQGFFLGERGLFDKRFMYEPSSRIPFIIRYPGITDAGASNDQLVLNIDLAPTLLDLAGVQIPEDMQGRSLRPLLRGDPPSDWREAIYYRLHDNDFRVVPHYGIRTDRYKLIHFKGRGYHQGETTRPFDTWCLFDLEKDPHETRNLYQDPGNQQLVARLKRKLRRLRARLGDPPARD
jgi:arylsulfatase A-like enzyme